MCQFPKQQLLLTAGSAVSHSAHAINVYNGWSILGSILGSILDSILAPHVHVQLLYITHIMYMQFVHSTYMHYVIYSWQCMYCTKRLNMADNWRSSLLGFVSPWIPLKSFSPASSIDSMTCSMMQTALLKPTIVSRACIIMFLLLYCIHVQYMYMYNVIL